MQDQNLNKSGNTIKWIITLVGIILLAALIWLLTGSKEEEVLTEVGTEKVLVLPEVGTESRKADDVDKRNYDFSEQLPLYDEQDDWTYGADNESLPELDVSDAEYTQDLLTVSAQLKQGLFSKEQIRKTIFSINDMAQGLRPPAKRLREITFPHPFSVTEEGGRMFMSKQAYHRYDTLAQAINSIDKQGLVALYKKYLPLFQKVFAEFSYPDNYQVLDSIKAATGKILQAPVITSEIEVIRPSVYYKFADPELEKLSALDKQMLRMGPENTRLIQNKLRELIEALIAAEQK